VCAAGGGTSAKGHCSGVFYGHSHFATWLTICLFADGD